MRTADTSTFSRRCLSQTQAPAWFTDIAMKLVRVRKVTIPRTMPGGPQAARPCGATKNFWCRYSLEACPSYSEYEYSQSSQQLPHCHILVSRIVERRRMPRLRLCRPASTPAPHHTAKLQPWEMRSNSAILLFHRRFCLETKTNNVHARPPGQLVFFSGYTHICTYLVGSRK